MSSIRVSREILSRRSMISTKTEVVKKPTNFLASGYINSILATV